jgi:glycosyltransferase involved in cell wall biosynthesis
VKVDQPIRILQVVLGLNQTGIDNVVMDLYRHIDRTRFQFDFVVFGSDEGTHEREVTQLGGRIFHVPTRTSNPWRSIQALGRIFKDHSYKIIHSHQDCLSGQVLKIAKKCGVAVRVAHAHTTNLPSGWRRHYYRINKNSIPKYANFFIGCTERSGRWMFGEDVVNSPKFEVLKNAIDTRRFSYDDKLRSNYRKKLGCEEATVVIHIGRLAYAKNHTFLFKIFKEYRNLDARAQLLIIGDGELRAALKQEVKDQGLTDSVSFMGARNDIPELLNAADIMVMPSLFEGLPLTCIESQTAGLKTLISDTIDPIVVFTSIIESRSLEHSPKEWADHMHSMLQDDLPRRNFVHEAIAARFDITNQAEHLMELYEYYLNGVVS